MNLGSAELLIILVLVVFLFGASRLPRLARSLGQAKRELGRGQVDASPSEEPLDST